MRQTLAKRDLNAKIERWALSFDEFDFETEHRAGSKMKHVDALSRIYMITLEEELEDGDEEEIEDRDSRNIKLDKGTGFFDTKLADEEGKDWPILLVKVGKGLINMISRTTKESATKLLFGLETSSTDRMEVEEWMDIVNRENNRSRDESRLAAEGEIEKVQEYNKEYYDKTVVREKSFIQGYLVMLKGRKQVGREVSYMGNTKGRI